MEPTIETITLEKEMLYAECMSTPEYREIPDYRSHIENILLHKCITYLVAHTRQIEHREVWAKAPSFFDWLFRRKRKFRFEVKILDLFRLPPAMPDKTLEMYRISNFEQYEKVI